MCGREEEFVSGWLSVSCVLSAKRALRSGGRRAVPLYEGRASCRNVREYGYKLSVNSEKMCGKALMRLRVWWSLPKLSREAQNKIEFFQIRAFVYNDYDRR